MSVHEAYLRGVYEDRIQNEFDHVLPIIADEGNGKSTWIMETIVLYRKIRGLDIDDTDALLEPLEYDREGVKKRMATAPKRSIIAVPDAGRVLHKKEAMSSEQVELEKDLFDVRTKEFLILLGFQDWGSVPTFLQERRAKNVIYIPRRGRWVGYNRSSLDEKLGMDRDEWPSADFGGSFPPLDGTDLWERYQEIDRKAKEGRMAGNDNSEDTADVVTPRDVVDEIKASDAVSYFVRELNNGSVIVDADLVQHDYPELTKPDAEQVKKVIERDVDVEAVVEGGEVAP